MVDSLLSNFLLNYLYPGLCLGEEEGEEYQGGGHCGEDFVEGVVTLVLKEMNELSGIQHVI